MYTTVQLPKSPSERLAKAFESAHRLFEPEVPKTSSYPGIAQTLAADAAQNAQDVRFKLGRVESATRPADCRCTIRDTHSTLDLSQRGFLSTSWQMKPPLGDRTKASELGEPFCYLDPSVGNSNNQKYGVPCSHDETVLVGRSLLSHQDLRPGLRRRDYRRRRAPHLQLRWTHISRLVDTTGRDRPTSNVVDTHNIVQYI